MNNILYLKQVIYENTQISEEFPFNLPTLRSLNELVFDTPVTFLLEKMVLENQQLSKQLQP
ncbi:hypothetical protein [Enterococcus rivorum]|uniref:hypothetical protein n=1 Tax=Enterococcus rivorum TaxID=762845 RepID=UPI0036286AAE